jgi:hypothetical protein
MPVGSFWMGVGQSSDRLLDVPKSIDHADDVLLLCNSSRNTVLTMAAQHYPQVPTFVLCG